MTAPFLKWVGGKRWLVNSAKFPKNLTFNRYIEPFLGGGAIFFHLQPSSAILSDINQELIYTYKAIRDNYKEVESLLRDYQTMHSKIFYYATRSSEPKDKVSIAAKMIYLNRTCWNGLYRVNKAGKFNVPIGCRDSVLRETDDFEKQSQLLKCAEIVHCDFETSIDSSLEGDLLFVDPPYTVKHNYNNFIKYNESIFSWSDQGRLKNSLLRAKERGVQIIMTNAYHQCIKDLYQNMGTCSSANRLSSLSAKPSGRGSTKEALFITNIQQTIRRSA